MYNLYKEKIVLWVFWYFSLFRNNLLDALRVIQIKSSLCRNWFETTNTYRGWHIRQNLKTIYQHYYFKLEFWIYQKFPKKVFLKKNKMSDETETTQAR